MNNALAVIFAIALMITGPAAWITHLVRCFTEEQWGFLIGGAIFFPVAIVHGVGIWFGAWEPPHAHPPRSVPNGSRPSSHPGL